jgi:hypothetical protein
MSLAAAFLLAASAAHPAPAPASEPSDADRGAQVESARVQATITRPAVLKDGVLLARTDGLTPRSQRRSREGRVTYEFE